MSLVTCWRLRRQLTAYADGELPVSERARVERHLAGCDACRRRVRIEQAVRQSLHDRTERAGSAVWLARPELPIEPSRFAWYFERAALAAGLAIVVVFWGGQWFGAVRVEAVGVISDSHCNGVHRPGGVSDVPAPDCMRGCLKKGAHYVFVAGDTTYTIRNPEFGDLIARAGRTIHVSGSARGAQLTLARIDAAP
jgi:hypothetical protein